MIRIDKIIRSARKTYSLEITPEAALVVRAPLKATQKEINEVVRQKSDWIITKQNDILNKLKAQIKNNFTEGEKFLLKGIEYPLVYEYDINYVFAYKNKTFILNSKYKAYARKVFIHWYRKGAKGVITEKAEQYSKLMGLKYNNLRITSAETRWGSCSGKKNLNFTWKLVMAPDEVIDYVVVHELAHLAQMNHSSRFWEIVCSYIPDYKKRRRWLKENGHLLDL